MFIRNLSHLALVTIASCVTIFVNFEASGVEAAELKEPAFGFLGGAQGPVSVFSKGSISYCERSCA